MPQYFVNEELNISKIIIVTGNDFHHLSHVRRVAPGSEIRLRDQSGIQWLAVVTELGSESLVALVKEKINERDNGVKLILAAALLKGKNFDLVIQKSVEIGVSRIIPFYSERTVPQPGERGDNKLDRWQRIADEAAKQCQRDSLPEIVEPVNFRKLVENNDCETRIIAHPDPKLESFKKYLTENPFPEEAILMVGPEGGFSRSELDYACDRGWAILNFGTTQLRAETAAIVLPAILKYEWSR